jgi:hypothetical protein
MRVELFRLIGIPLSNPDKAGLKSCIEPLKDALVAYFASATEADNSQAAASLLKSANIRAVLKVLTDSEKAIKKTFADKEAHRFTRSLAKAGLVDHLKALVQQSVETSSSTKLVLHPNQKALVVRILKDLFNEDVVLAAPDKSAKKKKKEKQKRSQSERAEESSSEDDAPPPRNPKKAKK